MFACTEKKNKEREKKNRAINKLDFFGKQKKSNQIITLIIVGLQLAGKWYFEEMMRAEQYSVRVAASSWRC